MSREVYTESVFLTRNTDGPGFVVKPINGSDKEDSTVERIVSNKKKLFFDNSEPYGHILTICLDMILKELSLTEEKFVILFALESGSYHLVVENNNSVTDYLAKRFIDLGHEVEYLNSDVAIVNNLVFNRPQQITSIPSVSRVINFLSHGLDYSTPPVKKIYLSRGKTTTYNGNTNMPMPSGFAENLLNMDEYRKNNQYKFSNRIDNEKLVEDYFIGLGFTIIYAEDINSFDEQLQLIASCKTVVSITSSSLTTCFVMAPNTSVVELSTPLENSSPISIDNTGFDVHTHYKIFSDTGRKNYLSIPHSRGALDLISSIENNPAVKSFLLG